MEHDMKSDEVYTPSWFARNFGLDRRTVIKRIKAVGVKPVRAAGSGNYYRVVDVAPLLVLEEVSENASFHLEVKQLTTSINRLSGILLRATDQD